MTMDQLEKIAVAIEALPPEVGRALLVLVAWSAKQGKARS